MYRKLFEGNLSLDGKQYLLFGNGMVMPATVLWHAARKGDTQDAAMFFDVTEIPLMHRLTRGLTEPLSEGEFLPRLMANIADLENLAVEIKRLVNVKEPAKVYKALSALV